MTKICWTDLPVKKARKATRALKFGNVKVGDQLVKKPRDNWHRGIPINYVVTDLWFDPVAGQEDPVKGQMVGYAQIKKDGTLSTKGSTTVRGLASQQFDYADTDYIEMAKARHAEMTSKQGKVVGIGAAHTIRARPKIPGGGH